MNQLIVLGNGFDIHCGLKSRYSDFFLDRFKTLFCKDKDNAQSIEELKDDLDEKRCKTLSFISNIRSHLNFSSNDNGTFNWDIARIEKYKRTNIIISCAVRIGNRSLLAVLFSCTSERRY